MFKPNDYDLDREYRQRQLNKANRAQQIREIEEEKTSKANPLFQANVMSLFWIIASVVALLIFFFGTSSSQAQDTFDAGSNGGASGSEVHMYLYSAVVAVQEDDLLMAANYFEEAIASVPNFAPAYIGRSYLALLDEDAESALADAEIALEITPDDAAVYYVLAEAHFALGNYGEAQAAYESYLAMVQSNGYQPILITSLLNDDSLATVNDHLAVCIEESTI